MEPKIFDPSVSLLELKEFITNYFNDVLEAAGDALHGFSFDVKFCDSPEHVYADELAESLSASYASQGFGFTMQLWQRGDIFMIRLSVSRYHQCVGRHAA